MTLVFVLFVISVWLELAAAWIPTRLALLRRLVVAAGIGLIIVLSIYLLWTDWSIWHGLVVILGVYRIVNLLRILKARMHQEYLRRVSLATTCWLAGAQAELWLAGIAWALLKPSTYAMWLLVATLQLLVATILYKIIRSHIRHAAEPAGGKAYAHSELPTLTVCVAARDETDSLIACIESLVASDYPKLEILVLDDCSQTRQTPEIIRSFAHQGVRFIPGAQPAANWLARNQAYDGLARAASGQYLLYCSTSARFEPGSIRKLVTYALNKDKTMLSVLPRYQTNGRLPLLEPMHAAWELLPPRRWFGRPPVISSCWLIKASALKAAGGFKAVSRMVTPEAFFAKSQTVTEGYSFLPGGAYYGVSSDKSYAEQRATAMRTGYPSLHKRPEMVVLISAVLVASSVLPFGLVLAVVFGFEYLPISLMSAAASALLLLAYQDVLRLTFGAARRWHVVSFPFAVLTAVGLIHYSMYRYEFSEVLWKDRNICIPVMHAIPHLPKI